MTELKPCPFCGSEAGRREHCIFGEVVEFAYCPNENCSFRHRTASVTDWNTRPIEDAILARAEQLEAMVERLVEAIESGAYLQVSPDPDIEGIQNWYAKTEAIIAEWKGREE
jgi:hypothetical protein